MGVGSGLSGRAGMRTAMMNEILSQHDVEPKKAIRASLAGDVKTAFTKLGDRVSAVNGKHIDLDVASRWLEPSPRERGKNRAIAPIRALRDRIEKIIRAYPIEEGAIHGPTR